jgi:ferredoxin like protein
MTPSDAGRGVMSPYDSAMTNSEAPPAGRSGQIVPVAPPAAWLDVSFEDRMGLVEFRVGTRAHITVDGDACRGCTTKACVTACPANLFVPTSDGGILFNYEQCFECGTCYMICNTEGAITWTYPDGGNGVVFHRS